MKNLKSFLVILLFPAFICAQKYFKPIPGGIENVIDGGSFIKVEIEGKTANEIFRTLHTMAKKSFTGENDEIVKVVEGESILAKGILQRYACQKKYDIRFEVEFKIKDGRYIFMFNRYNIVNPLTDYRIVFQKGSAFLSNLSSETGDDGKTFMFNRKGKMVLQKSCYKEIIFSMDQLGDLFDISDDYQKYAEESSKLDNDW